jgi:nucleotide-binding universal stress UspA family protein
MTSIERILVASDFSEHSSRALDLAIDFALKFGARIELVHAFDVPVPFVTPYEVAVPDTFMQEAREFAKKKLAGELDRVIAAGVEASSNLTEVPAATAIARVAEEIGADLLVMGTRGHTGLKHALLGSVAERTLRHSPCPVLTVK